MKIKSKKILGLTFKWLGVIVAMSVFAVIAVLIGNWMQDKLWMFLVLDVLVWFCLWLILQLASYLNGRRSYNSRIILLVLLGALIASTLGILVAATVALSNLLLVRLNTVLFMLSSFAIIYFSFKRRGVFD